MAVPSQPGEALTGSVVWLLRDRTAWTALAAVLDVGSDEGEMHRRSFRWARAPQMGGFRCCASQDAPQCQDAVTT